MIWSKTYKIVFTTIGMLGFVFCLLGGVLFSYFPSIIDQKIRQNLMLTEDSESFEKWQNPPVPIYMQYYLFNVTNPEEVNANYAKPNLQEVGPYTFRIQKKKMVSYWDLEKGRLHYETIKSFIFELEMSIGDMSEEIYTLNVPYVGIASKLTSMLSEDILPYLVADLTANFRNMSVQYIEKHTAHEMLFGGYYVELLDFLAKYAEDYGMEMPKSLPNNTFGLMYGRNNSHDSSMIIGTGTVTPRDTGVIYQYNNMSALTYWGTEYCNKINGTDGTQFSPGLTKKDRLYAFSPDLCRSLHLDYEATLDVEGIPVYRYVVPDQLFEDPKENADNDCYCIDRNNCLTTGALDLSVCKKGSPVVASSPHFYLAADKYMNRVSGLTPSKLKHQTFVDVEPLTGIVLNAAKRIQININVKYVKGLYHLQNIKDMLFPIFWLSESAHITDEVANKFRAKISTPMLIGNVVLLSILVLGVVALLVSLALSVHFVLRQKTTSQMDLKSHDVIDKNGEVLPRYKQ